MLLQVHFRIMFRIVIRSVLSYNPSVEKEIFGNRSPEVPAVFHIFLGRKFDRIEISGGFGDAELSYFASNIDLS